MPPVYQPLAVDAHRRVGMGHRQIKRHSDEFRRQSYRIACLYLEPVTWLVGFEVFARGGLYEGGIVPLRDQRRHLLI